MKTRNGFVSNSSSSSFIVVKEDFKKNKPIIADLNIRMDLSKLIEETISTEEEFKKYILDNDCFMDDDFNKDDLDSLIEHSENFLIDKYRDWQKFIKEGKTICICSASSDSGDALEYLLYEYDISDLNFKIEGAKVYEG